MGGAGPVTLDEVQREPELLRAVKRAIDRDRTPGRFLLTGSANLLLMRQVSESLAGRASYLTLWPMTRREQRGLGRCGRLGRAARRARRGLARPAGRAAGQRRGLARARPPRRLSRRRRSSSPRAADRAIWFDGYVRTYLERDLQDLAVDQRAARLPPSDARRLPARRPARQPDRARPRRGACRSRPCIAGSTCSRPRICSCACRPTP